RVRADRARAASPGRARGPGEWIRDARSTLGRGRDRARGRRGGLLSVDEPRPGAATGRDSEGTRLGRAAAGGDRPRVAGCDAGLPGRAAARRRAERAPGRALVRGRRGRDRDRVGRSPGQRAGGTGRVGRPEGQSGQVAGFRHRTREQYEQEERERLAPWAACAGDSAGRLVAEPEHPYRTAFQRDRDRIVHARAFRRLEFKTQVFVYVENDHYRNRLTHTIEAAQMARSIARALYLNEDLAEAIVLAHDL